MYKNNETDLDHVNTTNDALDTDAFSNAGPSRVD